MKDDKKIDIEDGKNQAKSMVDLYRSMGINSKDTTEEYLGKTTIVFMGSDSKPKTQEEIDEEMDNNIGDSIHYLKQRRGR